MYRGELGHTADKTADTHLPAPQPAGTFFHIFLEILKWSPLEHTAHVLVSDANPEASFIRCFRPLKYQPPLSHPLVRQNRCFLRRQRFPKLSKSFYSVLNISQNT